MRKKNPTVCLAEYRSEIEELKEFLAEAKTANISDASITRCYDYVLLGAYRAFEQFILQLCITRINRDPAAFYDSVGVGFGQHITADQCEFLLVGDGYFDFRGHGGLVNVVRRAAGKDTPMHALTKNSDHRKTFEILASLRNYVAHQSTQSRRAALKAMQHWEPDRKSLGKAGSWLKALVGGQTRMERLLLAADLFCDQLREAAQAVAE